MTEVAFHFNVPDKLGYACRLLRKATRSGRRCMVVTESGQVGALDQLLWTFASDEFLPHASAAAPDVVRRHSPIVVGDAVLADWAADVLVNLSAQVPDGAQAFARVVEIVGLDEQDRSQARQRWKHYSGAGCALVRHDLAAGGGEA